MDLNFFLGIVGLLLTLVFGYFGLTPLFQARKYPGSIIFLQQYPIRLFRSIVENFPEIKILYNDKPIDKHIVLVNGYFYNNGQIDIGEGMIDEPLRISLPNGCSWLNADIASRSLGNKTKLTITENNVIQFDLGLFRKNEYFKFEGLAHINSLDNEEQIFISDLHEELNISYRIANTVEPSKAPLELWKGKFPFRKYSFYLMLFILTGLGTYMFYSYFKFKDRAYLYTDIKSGNSTVSLEVQSFINDSVKLYRPNETLHSASSVSEFFKNNYNNLYTRRPGVFLIYLPLFTGIFTYIFFIMCCYKFVVDYREYIKMKKLRVHLGL